jgi:trimethylamine--corrinoid protein Co-methyltransferase
MMEPRTGGSIWGGVEMGLASAATVQIGHRYNLPVNVYGLSTNAHSLDIQDGYERALNSLLPALAGADELSGIGEMNAGVMGSHAQMVADNDIAASVKRAIRGFSVDPDSLAFEVIARVMEGAHNYLAEMHTVRYLRSGELVRTKLGERGSFEEWLAADREGMTLRAQAVAEKILAEHEVDPLTEQQESALDALLIAAKAELTGQA